MKLIQPRRLVASLMVAASLALLPSMPSIAQQSNEELAKAAQNPLASLISVPFQLNTNFDSGPEERTQNVLNIQPVVPFSLNEDWNLISRTIMPLIWQPASTPFEGSTFGLGDIQLNGFLSPKNSGSWIWGVGAVAQLPTHTNDRLGNDRWGLGPTAVVLHLEKGSPWVFGALINNIWSVSGSSTDPKINQLTLQPFLNYNFPGGFYLTSSPLITANWEAAGGQKWIVPMGGGVGKIVRFGKLPVNLQASAYYNVERPDNAPRWALRLQAQLMFPK
ncbi:transporter [Variovorax sp. J22P271]|uniref:transporter n=1 Tax=Variovorax davisae TaxID=3053515 RepID=UPI002575C79A|nr:transporter [Variovorax sp. J22P271]MDM0037007.1 transporter [Variovorax sp. J22P271]